MNEGILNPYTIITVLSFLGIFVLVAFFVRRKSVSLKKIINNKKINIIEYSPIRGGYSAMICSIENEKFFLINDKYKFLIFLEIIELRWFNFIDEKIKLGFFKILFW